MYDQQIKLLIIGYKDWTDQFTLKLSDYNCHLQIINDKHKALSRLKHNSYDVLLLQQEYENWNSIDLSQMAFAMSRPTIIFCTSYIKYFLYSLWKIIGKWPNKHKISKQFIFFKIQNNKRINLNFYPLLLKHDMINKISKSLFN